ncbi:VIT1/CCC1 transporter family protein [Microbacterium terricola]|uniref:3-oxoacyl-ACP reductase n=1 Tax=Microbacterium terricola TaxID=344163 RepID=A0ABM8DX25_9MICO|nr:VIT1/CCC1 transporter family protein [Microbacterium terricola]UYK39131.1 VIT1/CCC1 transporter family protein [Microbacterium terricola]BDV30155.1 hypothetical protein Microterr_08150 [Microbacterium terricola]
MTPNPVTSTPILRTTLIWSGIVTAALAVVGGLIGYAVGQAPGLWSALIGVLVGAVFLAITGLSILIANRWYGDPLYVPLFFGIVLGGWILKFVVFIVVLIVLRGQEWVNDTVFFFSLVTSVLASLAIDVVTLLRMRVPQIDVELPSHNPEDGPDEAPSGHSAPR